MEVGALHDGLCDPLATNIVGARRDVGYCGPTHQVSTFISDRDPRFIAQFWRIFQRAMGTQMRMSIVFHP